MKETGIVILAFGPLPADTFGKAAKLAGKAAVMDTDLARMAGATFAFGMPEDLAGLRQLLEPGTVAKERAAHPTLSDNAVMWLASGARGLSSETLFTFLTGVDAEGDHGHNYPHDPADLRRCRLLLDQCPELVSCLPRVANAHPVWAALVARWDELCAVMDEENPEWRQGRGSGPKTYALMKEIITPAGGY